MPLKQFGFGRTSRSDARWTTTIVDADLSETTDFNYPVERFVGRMRRRGQLGLAGHTDPVRFRNVKIKRLERASDAK